MCPGSCQPPTQAAETTIRRNAAVRCSCKACGTGRLIMLIELPHLDDKQAWFNLWKGLADEPISDGFQVCCAVPQHERMDDESAAEIAKLIWIHRARNFTAFNMEHRRASFCTLEETKQ